jgi:hypothetical protein
MLIVLSLVSIGSILPELLNAQADTAKSKVAKGIKTVIVLAPADVLTSDTVRLRQCRPGLQCKNGFGGIHIVVLKSGESPTRPIKAIVETDSDCAPDANGISHCSNRLRLSDGRFIEVRHDHDMRAFPCLISGETVELKPQISVGGRPG